jgi:transposase-like protein
MEAAKQFFQQAVGVVGHVPDQVTTDGHTSYPRAIRETMSSNVQHRTNKYPVFSVLTEPLKASEMLSFSCAVVCPGA